MWMTRLKTRTVILMATVTVACGGLLAQQPPAAQPVSLVAAAETKSKPADSAEMAQIDAKLAKLRELIKPRPGEFVTNMAKIAWERDPWAAAVKAAKEGKPVIAYGVRSAGVTCGYG